MSKYKNYFVFLLGMVIINFVFDIFFLQTISLWGIAIGIFGLVGLNIGDKLLNLKIKDLKILKNIKCAIRAEVILICVSIAFLISIIYFKLHVYIGALVFSILILIFSMCILIAILKSTTKAISVTAIFMTLILIINYGKIKFLGEPIWITDIYMLKNLPEIVSLVKGDIWDRKILEYIVEVLVVFTSIIVLVKNFNINFEKLRSRCLLFGIGSLGLILLLNPVQSKEQWVSKNIYGIYNRIDEGLNMLGPAYYHKYCTIGGMYGQQLERKISIPEEFDEKQVEEYLANVESVDKNNLRSPNIILMFAEAFWDVDKIEEIKFDKNIFETFNKLKDKGKYLELITPSYGGASANVEFEVLTGGNMRYFNNGVIPFTYLYKNRVAENYLSIVRELTNNNYKAKMFFGKDAYLSKESYLNLGMDEYYNLQKDFEDYDKYIDGIYLSDEKLVDFLIQELETKKNNEKIFCSMATIASHKPFTIDKYQEYDFEVVKTELDEEDTLRLKAYAQGMYDVNQQIYRIYEYIQKYEEDTIFIVLGDHLPYITNDENEDILANTSYFDTKNTIDKYKKKYTVPCLVLANYDLDMQIPSIIGTDMLLTSIINNMDIEISNYYKWLYNTIDIYAGGNRYISVDGQGNFYNTHEINNEMKRIYDMRENIQYKFLQ